MHLKIVTVDKVLFEGEITSITTQNCDGYFEILNDHSPFITLTEPSRTRIIKEDGKEEVLFTSTGIMKVLNNDVLFITDTGEFKSDIDKARAERSKERAKERLNDRMNQIDLERAKASLRRADERLKVLE